MLVLSLVWLVLAFWVDPREFCVWLCCNAMSQFNVQHVDRLFIVGSHSTFSVIKKVGTCNSLRIRYSSASPLAMTFLLPFVLILAHRLTQLVQASSSIALPLLVRSPYFSCWLPQLNSILIHSFNEYGLTATSDFSHGVCSLRSTYRY